MDRYALVDQDNPRSGIVREIFILKDDADREATRQTSPIEGGPEVVAVNTDVRVGQRVWVY